MQRLVTVVILSCLGCGEAHSPVGANDAIDAAQAGRRDGGVPGSTAGPGSASAGEGGAATGAAGTATAGGAGSPVAGATGAGGSAAPAGALVFASHAIGPSADCLVMADSDAFLAGGLYDIANSGDGNGTGCERPYQINVLVNSLLEASSDADRGRTEPNILQLHSAQVRLATVEDETIDFARAAPALPNPFLVTTNNSVFPSSDGTPSLGIAAVEAIPSTYASQLTGFVGARILVELTLYATTIADEDVDLPPFLFPVEICDHCLTVCQRALASEGRTAEDVTAGTCADNAGADGRFCVDEGC